MFWDLLRNYVEAGLLVFAVLIVIVGPVLLHCEWRYRCEVKEARRRAERIEHPLLTAHREGSGLGLRRDGETPRSDRELVGEELSAAGQRDAAATAAAVGSEKAA